MVTIESPNRLISLDELIKAGAYAMGLAGDTKEISEEVYQEALEHLRKYPHIEAIHYAIGMSGEAVGTDYYEGEITIKPNGEIETEGRYYIFDNKK